MDECMYSVYSIDGSSRNLSIGRFYKKGKWIIIRKEKEKKEKGEKEYRELMDTPQTRTLSPSQFDSTQ